MVILRAFATELMLKVLSFKKTGHYKEVHRAKNHSKGESTSPRPLVLAVNQEVSPSEGRGVGQELG